MRILRLLLALPLVLATAHAQTKDNLESGKAQAKGALALTAWIQDLALRRQVEADLAPLLKGLETDIGGEAGALMEVRIVRNASNHKMLACVRYRGVGGSANDTLRRSLAAPSISACDGNGLLIDCQASRFLWFEKNGQGGLRRSETPSYEQTFINAGVSLVRCG